jgi:hypothetical protein
VLVDYCILFSVDWLRVAVGARHFVVNVVAGDDIAAAGDLVVLGVVAVYTHDTRVAVHVVSRCGDISVLKVRAASCLQMAAQAHIGRRSLRVLGSDQHVHPLGRGELDRLALLDHSPAIVWGVADQAINVGIVCFGQLVDRVGLGAQAGMALSTTTWLCR